MTGRAEAQTMYQSHASLPPLVLDFHFKMLEVELKESHPNLEFLRQVYENAAMQFGQKNSGTNEKDRKSQITNVIKTKLSINLRKHHII